MINNNDTNKVTYDAPCNPRTLRRITYIKTEYAYNLLAITENIS